MSLLEKALRVATLCALLSSAACGDDGADESPGAGRDPSSLLDAGSAPGDAATGDGGLPAADPLYLVGSSIQTSSESVMYLWTTKQLAGAKLDLKRAREMPGASDVVLYNGFVYVANSEKMNITRYAVQGDQLVEGPAVSFLGQGLQYVSYLKAFLSPERAFMVNDQQHKIIEWNPTTMTITKLHDIGALKRAGWGDEFRGGFLRDDGKLVMHWTYTNDRKDFLNTFTVGVWDALTGTLTIEEDPSCPTSAGFGGYFDEQGDLYLIADSFGLFTQFGGFKDPKPACVLRVKKGETKLDPTYKLRPSDAMGGHYPWGFYYLGNGLAFTSGIDPAVTMKFDSVFETLFAREHGGWLLDTKSGTARKIENLPKDGVGFESHTTDGRLFVPRTSGSVVVESIMSIESTLFEIKPDATAAPILTLPGYISPIIRLR